MAEPSAARGPSPPPVGESTSTSSPPGVVVAVTGAGGALGQALLRRWHQRGAQLIALSSGERELEIRDRFGRPLPLRQVRWTVGQEAALADLLEEVDVLVINHGLNVHGDRSALATDRSLQVNALSGWRLLELFAEAARQRGGQRGGQRGRPRPEVWVNTSEAEVQPAFSPLYEISKRLLGQLLSLRALDLAGTVRIRRLVLGPFRSELNPIGVMGADWVAGEVLRQAGWDWGLIVVSPNPLTYLTMPLASLGRWLYFSLISRPSEPGASGSGNGRSG